MSKSRIDFESVMASSIHDIKNSLGMLLHNLETMGEEVAKAAPEGKQHVTDLQYQISRVNSELIHLLAIYRMGRKTLPVNIAEHYLDEFFEEQIIRNQSLFDSANIELALDIEDDLAWYFDADLIGNVINNILINCVKYGRSKVLIEASRAANGLLIRVADDGNGYPANMIEDGHAETQPIDLETGSTKLGLYFARQAVELHEHEDRHGEIKLSNGAPLGGGVFEIRLP